jgi:hypothetical protein
MYDVEAVGKKKEGKTRLYGQRIHVDRGESRSQ